MKILISTWGNPLNWNIVKYKYKKSEKEIEDPLPLIKEEEKIDKIIIISLDTLADEKIGTLTHICYNGLKKQAERIIENFCIAKLNCPPDKIIISYGVGEFNKTKFIGNAMDYYYSIFKELSLTLKEWLESSSSQKLKIFLDISHGINFLPVLTYRALREVLQILAYSFEIELTVLNSDTYIRSAKPSQLNVNVIEKIKILPKLTVYYSNQKIIKPFTHLKEKEKQKIGKDLFTQSLELPDEIFCFLSSYIYALPVFVTSYMPSYNTLKAIIDKISKVFERYISIDHTSACKIKIIRNTEFTINFENLIKAFLVSWLLSSKCFGRQKDISLKKIKYLNENIWRNKFPVESNRIDVEIHKIQEVDELTEEYQPYFKLLGKDEGKNIDKRNFFSHAGFEHNVIQIKKEIIITINPNYEDEAKKLLKDNLPRSEL
ncbi:MAG: CRISPR-associated CARF protein Csx1 [Candidatus Hydrothermales bacterium]